jgi:hypothetical protein
MRSRRQVVVVLVFLVMVLMVIPVRAQEGGGLTDEESRLLDRVFAARDIQRGWSSYVEQANGIETREMALSSGPEAQVQSTVASWDRTSTVIRDGNAFNIQSAMTVTVTNEEAGMNSQSYTMNADVRLVDRQLYVRAAYDGEPQSGWPSLPEGWVMVRKLSDWPGFQSLNLGDFLQQATPFDNPERLKAVNPTVTLEAGTLDDGTAVEIITVDLDVQAIQTLFSTSINDSSMKALIDGLGGDTAGVLLFVLSPDDNRPYQIETRVTLQALGLNAQKFGQGNSPNTQLDLTTSFLRSESYSQINESFEPAAVPEELAQ